MTLNFWSSCLHLSAEIDYRCVPFCWLHVVLGWNPGMQGFQLGRQALYQLSYISSLSSLICLLTQVLNLSVVLGKQAVESELGIAGLLLCTFRIIHQVTGGCLDLDNGAWRVLPIFKLFPVHSFYFSLRVAVWTGGRGVREQCLRLKWAQTWTLVRAPVSLCCS